MACMLCLTLASCAHECVFVDEWSSDDTSHWHACEKEKCEEVADKADHTWDEGVITTEATQEADGVKTFTCTVCKHTKTEAVAFTGLTKEAWNALLSADVFKNFTYVEAAKSSAPGVTAESKMTYKFTEDKAWVKIEAAGQTREDSATGTDASQAKTQLNNSIKEIAKFDKYKYDAATKTYLLDGDVKLAALGNTKLDTASIKIENGKMSEIKYSCTITTSGVTTTVEATISLYDYGTTVIS